MRELNDTERFISQVTLVAVMTTKLEQRQYNYKEIKLFLTFQSNAVVLEQISPT